MLHNRVINLIKILIPIASLWILNSAHAQDLPCSAPVGSTDIVEKMNEAETALAEFDLGKYRTILMDVHDVLPCVYDRVHPNYITRYARQMAMAYFLDQDEMTMAQWGTLASANGDLPWPASLDDETHPFRDHVALEVGEKSCVDHAAWQPERPQYGASPDPPSWALAPARVQPHAASR